MATRHEIPFNVTTHYQEESPSRIAVTRSSWPHLFRNTCRNVEFYLITFRIQKSLTIITFLLCTKNHVVFTYYMDVFFMKIHVFPRCKKSFNGVKSRQFSEKKVSLKLAKQYSFWQIIALHSNASTRIMKISHFVSLLPCS